MSITHFHDFKCDDGSPISVEYSAAPGEPNFDFPGHICDGGGSGPEISIIDAWREPSGEKVKLTDQERERMETWLCENYVDEPEPEDFGVQF